VEDATNRRGFFPSFALEPLKRRIIGAGGRSSATALCSKFAIISRLESSLRVKRILTYSSINRDEHGRRVGEKGQSTNTKASRVRILELGCQVSTPLLLRFHARQSRFSIIIRGRGAIQNTGVCQEIFYTN